MHVISRKRLKQASETHPTAATAIDRWYRIANRAEWHSIVDVRASYRDTDPVNRYTVFNLGGNNYRLITVIEYRFQQVYIMEFLTHAEYDEWSRRQRSG
jgi:mRNA interferase HigB